MTIYQVQTYGDLEKLYEENNLTTTTEKINFLKAEMKIQEYRREENLNSDQILTDYEGMIISGIWRALI